MKKFLVSVMLIFVAMLTFACGEPTIKITFDVNGGVGENQVVNVVEGEQINNIKEPTRTDYEFGGWYYDKDIWQDAFDGKADPSRGSEQTVYAKWLPIATYTVTFDVNGGSDVNATNTITAREITTEPVITRGDDIFLGWYTADNVKVTFPYIVSSDITLYAHWQAYPIATVNFYVDNVLYESKQVLKGEVLTLPKAPTKLGYDFQYWMLGDIQYDTTSIVQDSFDLTAYFEIQRNTVTFKNGDTIVATFEVEYGESFFDTYTVPDLDSLPNIDGYTKSWVNLDGLNNVTADTVCYLQYSPNEYTVTFDVDFVGAVASFSEKQVTFCEAIGALPTVISIEEYEFIGWYYNDTLINEEYVVNIPNDFTLTAKYEFIVVDRECNILSTNEFVAEGDTYKLDLDGENLNLSVTVRNKVSEINLAQTLNLSENCTYSLYQFASGDNFVGEITSKKLPLTAGMNTAFILVRNTVEDLQLAYTLNVYRSKALSVFYYNFDNCVNIDTIDEKFEVVENFNSNYNPGDVDDFKFVGWTTAVDEPLYEFGQYISSNLTLYAKYESPNDYSHFEYTVQYGEVSVVCDTNYDKSEVTVPSVYQIYKVTVIGDNAFKGMKNLTQININPNLITKIGEYAFSGTGISEITLHIDDIADYAFANCQNLQSYNTLKFVSLGENAFANCSNLTSSLYCNSIGAYAFLGCTSLTSVYVNDNVSGGAFTNCENLNDIHFIKENISIYSYAFEGCVELNYIELPALNIVGEDVFKNCTNLNLIVAPSINWSGQNWNSGIPYYIGTVINVDNMKFIQLSGKGIYFLRVTDNAENVVIPNQIANGDVVGVVENAFKCSNVNSIEIGDNVNVFDRNSFIGCPLYENKDNWIDGCLYIDDVLVAVEDQEVINIQEGTTYIVNDALNHLNNLKVLTIPNSMIKIPVGVLKGTNNIQNITIPYIGTSADAVDVEAYFGSIFGYSTEYMEGTITQTSNVYFYIPSNIETITITGDVVLSGLNSIPNVKTINALNATRVESQAVQGCETLITLNLGNKCTYIGQNAISNTSISVLLLEASVTEINNIKNQYDTVPVTVYSKLSRSADKTFVNDYTSVCKIYYLEQWEFGNDGVPYAVYTVNDNDLNENYPHNLSIQLNTNFANNEVLREVKFNKSFNTNAISVRAKISFESDNLLASELVDQLNQIDFNIATLSGEYTWSERINGYYFLVNSTNKMYQLQTNDIITLSNGVIIPDIIFESEDYKTYCSDIVLKVELQALWNVGGYTIEEADANFSNKYGGSAFN